MKILFIIGCLVNSIFPQKGFPFNTLDSELLSETPINPIPQEMTFEEYQDMNRRLSIGLILAAVPIPGTIHSYAGEIKTAKRLRWVAAGSIMSIIIGVMSFDGKEKWGNSPYELHIINEGKKNEKRFEMIPVGKSNYEIDYKLREIFKESELKGTSFIIPLGMGMLISSYLYDYIHGIKVIEEKRDRVRFKYGKKLNFSFSTIYNYQSQYAGVNVSFRF